MKEIGPIERPDGLGIDFANFFNNRLTSLAMTLKVIGSERKRGFKWR